MNEPNNEPSEREQRAWACALIREYAVGPAARALVDLINVDEVDPLVVVDAVAHHSPAMLADAKARREEWEREA